MPLPSTRRSAIGERLRNRAGFALTRQRRRGRPSTLGAVDARARHCRCSRARPTFGRDRQDDLAVERRRGLERPGVAHLGVLERDERLRRRRSPAPGVSIARALRSPSIAASAASCSAWDSTRAAARSSSRQVRVAARHRDAVGLAHERAAAHVDRADRDRRSSAGSRRAAGSPCGRRTRSTDRRSRTASSTTVVTPSKCTGRAAPHRPSVSPATCTVGQRRARRDTSRRRGGTNSTSTPSGRRDRRVAVEVARVRGEVLVRTELRRVHEQRDDDEVRRVARRGASANGGLRGSSPSSGRARRSGPRARACSQCSRSSATRSMTIIGAPRRARDRPARTSRCASRASVAVRVALVAGERVEVAAHRLDVAARDRAGERGGRHRASSTFSTVARTSGRNASSGIGATRSTWSSSATRWFDAMHAAAW